MRTWYERVVSAGADPDLPGIYEWVIEGRGSYIGKYTRPRRPNREYARNVEKLAAGLPYRKSDPDGFRRIHHELHCAKLCSRKVTLRIVENCEPDLLYAREAELIRERGNLNGPAPSGAMIGPNLTSVLDRLRSLARSSPAAP